MSRSAVFLDRDGVINSYFYNSEFGTVDSPSNPDEFELFPGASDAIALFHDMGMLIVVVSNQPGIAKGKFSAEMLRATTDKMMDACGGKIDAVYYCLHHPNVLHPLYRGECECRKPRPGLLLQAAAEWDIDLSSSVMIGDRLTDVVAGKDAGTFTILIGDEKSYISETTETHGVIPDFTAARLADTVTIVKKLFFSKMTTMQGEWQYELRCDVH